jgi:hypothetical protein
MLEHDRQCRWSTLQRFLRVVTAQEFPGDCSRLIIVLPFRMGSIFTKNAPQCKEGLEPDRGWRLQAGGWNTEYGIRNAEPDPA